MQRIATLAVVALLAACGSDSDGSSATSDGVLGGDGRYSDVPQGTYWSPDMPNTGCFYVITKHEPTDPPGPPEYDEGDVLEMGNSNGFEIRSGGQGLITEGCGVWEQR